MERHHEQIEVLQRRIEQNMRHLDEMKWALLKSADDAPSLVELDEHGLAIQAENAKFLAEIEKLENRAA